MKTLHVFAYLLVSALVSTAAHAASLTITVDAAGVARTQNPVTVQVKAGKQLAAADIEALAKRDNLTITYDDGGKQAHTWAQVEPVRDDAGKVVAAKVRFVVDGLAADAKRDYTLSAKAAPLGTDNFWFKSEDDGLHRDLYLGDRPVWRHAYLKYDPNNHFDTYKHFHHLYGMHGEGIITNGPRTVPDPKKIRYPHHRGLYIGWSKTRSASGQNDFWHCRTVTIRHQDYDKDAEFVGPVAARTVSTANWTDKSGKAIVIERRQVTAWNIGKGATLMDLQFTLKANDGDVELNGDPQHAGFQFRPHNSATGVSYTRPASASGGKGDVWKTTPWVVNQFKVGEHTYAVMHMDHPKNPGTHDNRTVYSTRGYGRFGAYAPHKLPADSPLTFHYRILVLDPTVHKNLSAEHFDAAHAGFAKPAKAMVK